MTTLDCSSVSNVWHVACQKIGHHTGDHGAVGDDGVWHNWIG